MTEVMAEIAMLRAEVEQLRGEIAQLQKPDDGLGGGEGCDVGLPLVPVGGGGEPYGAFRIEGNKITQCHFQFGRKVYSIEDVEGSGEGTYYLKIPHDFPSGAEVVTASEPSDLTQTVIPLFRAEKGVVVRDYRGMPVVPARE